MRRVALHHLEGVGDRGHEWEEWSGYAFHVRRRLTAEEQKATGPALDLRGTDSAARRFDAVKGVIPAPLVGMAVEEIGS